jgi:hypothetical protein
MQEQRPGGPAPIVHQLDALASPVGGRPNWVPRLALKKFRWPQPFPAWRVFTIVTAHWTPAPAGHSPYAPKWARDPCARRHGPLRPVGVAEEPPGWGGEGIGSILARAGDPLSPETNLSVNHFLERSLRPAIVPPPTARAPAPFSVVEILCGSIIGIAAGIAITLFTIGKIPPAASIELSDNSAAPFSARFEAVPERPL